MTHDPEADLGQVEIPRCSATNLLHCRGFLPWQFMQFCQMKRRDVMTLLGGVAAVVAHYARAMTIAMQP